MKREPGEAEVRGWTVNVSLEELTSELRRLSPGETVYEVIDRRGGHHAEVTLPGALRLKVSCEKPYTVKVTLFGLVGGVLDVTYTGVQSIDKLRTVVEDALKMRNSLARSG